MKYKKIIYEYFKTKTQNNHSQFTIRNRYNFSFTNKIRRIINTALVYTILTLVISIGFLYVHFSERPVYSIKTLAKNTNNIRNNLLIGYKNYKKLLKGEEL